MKFEIENFKIKHASKEFLAQFDARLDIGIIIRDLALFQPVDEPGVVRIISPLSAKWRRTVVCMREELRSQIGARAAAIYNLSTGRTVKYSSPEYYKGVLKTIGAESEALAMAGI